MGFDREEWYFKDRKKVRELTTCSISRGRGDGDKFGQITLGDVSVGLEDDDGFDGGGGWSRDMEKKEKS